jgi:hypothetical protein
MPNTQTQLRFFEHCSMCGAMFPDSLIRIPQMTEAAKRLSKFLDALLNHPGESVEYLKKQYGEPTQNAVFDMLHSAECPNCGYQSDGPTREAREAAAAIQELLSQVESLSVRIVT